MGTATQRILVERRKEDQLRALIDNACKGVMPHIAERIKKAARDAYYVGCLDGMTIKQDQLERDRK